MYGSPAYPSLHSHVNEFLLQEALGPHEGLQVLIGAEHLLEYVGTIAPEQSLPRLIPTSENQSVNEDILV